MPGRIFISYSKADPKPTRELADFLTAQGYSVWWDTNLTAGEVFREVIDRELDAADAVIVIWTAHSVASNWVIAEADHGARRNRLITLRAADVEPWRIPKPYNTYQADPVDNRDAVLAAVHRLLGKPLKKTRSVPAHSGGNESLIALPWLLLGALIQVANYEIPLRLLNIIPITPSYPENYLANNVVIITFVTLVSSIALVKFEAKNLLALIFYRLGCTLSVSHCFLIVYNYAVLWRIGNNSNWYYPGMLLGITFLLIVLAGSWVASGYWLRGRRFTQD
jgi:hypothetical protein